MMFHATTRLPNNANPCYFAAYQDKSVTLIKLVSIDRIVEFLIAGMFHIKSIAVYPYGGFFVEYFEDFQGAKLFSVVMS